MNTQNQLRGEIKFLCFNAHMKTNQKEWFPGTDSLLYAIYMWPLNVIVPWLPFSNIKIPIMELIEFG
jgi:hypothetical protein